MSLDFEAVKAYGEEIREEKKMMDGIRSTPETPEISTVAKIDFSFLSAKTGSGSVDDYVEHPLNFSKSRGMAQILRGCTGIAGDLDLAIVDIAIGGFNLLLEGKKKHVVE